MIVTGIEEITRSRYRVFIDEKFAFVLNKSELSRYKMKLNKELTDEEFQRIRIESVLKRAKLRALHLLNTMGRTEMQLRQKLLDSEYPEDIVEEVLEYVKSFGYVDDVNYSKNFILSRKEKKSKLEIRMLLQKKGVANDIIDIAMEECLGKDDTINAIKEILRKRKIDPKHSDPKEVQKAFGYLMRKGFRYEDIKNAFSELDYEDFC